VARANTLVVPLAAKRYAELRLAVAQATALLRMAEARPDLAVGLREEALRVLEEVSAKARLPRIPYGQKDREDFTRQQRDGRRRKKELLDEIEEIEIPTVDIADLTDPAP